MYLFLWEIKYLLFSDKIRDLKWKINFENDIGYYGIFIVFKFFKWDKCYN